MTDMNAALRQLASDVLDDKLMTKAILLACEGLNTFADVEREVEPVKVLLEQLQRRLEERCETVEALELGNRPKATITV